MVKSKNLLLYLMCGYVFLEIMVNTNFTEVIPETIINAVRYFLIIVMLINACVIVLNSRRWLLYCIFAVIALLTLLFAKTTFVLVLFSMFVLSSKYEHTQIVLYLNYTLIFILFLTVITSALGLIPSDTSIRFGENRISLGFGSCTMPQSLLMFVSLNFLYLKHKDIKFLLLLFEFIVATVFYYYTKARTGYFLTIIILCINFLIKFKFKFSLLKKLSSQKIIVFFITGIPVIFLLVSILMTYLFSIDNSFALKINRLISSRLVFQRNAFFNHPLTLFGEKVIWLDDYGNYCGVDNSYLFYIFNYGIISTILLYSIVSLNLYKSLKNKNYILTLILIIICVNAIVEPYLVDFKYNFFIFYISAKSVSCMENKCYKKKIAITQTN